jgi:hypothetical protein
MTTPTITLSLNYNSASNVTVPYNGNSGNMLAIMVTDPESGFDITSLGTYTYNLSNASYIAISNSTTPTANVTTTAIGGPTTITVTFTQATGVPGTYNQTNKTMNVNVAKGDQTVTFYPSSISTKAVGDAPIQLIAEVSGQDFANYGAITYSSSNPSVVDIAGSTATFVGAGSAQIIATAAETSYYNPGFAYLNATVTGGGGGGGGIPCFTAGTMIRVPSGEVAVETLKAGDLVVTAAGRTVPLKAALTTHVEKTTVATAPYLIPAGTYGSAQPRELVLSPAHAFQIRKGVWLAPCAATKLNPAVRQIRVGEEVTYYHLECPVFLRDNLVANGCVTESFGSRQMTKHPYTWSSRLGGFTRSPASSHVTRA